MSMASMTFNKAFLGGSVGKAPQQAVVPQRRTLVIRAAGLKEMKDRISSVKNTKKITEAMKLVAAAKVRRAQDAVVNGRPFAENLVQVLYGVNQRLMLETVDSPLCDVRPIKTVTVLVTSGDRGLCGGFNSFILKKAVQRIDELQAMGVAVKVVAVGNKAKTFFKRRPQYDTVASYSLGQAPTVKEAQAIADEIFAEFVSGETDKVELIYTKFVSLLTSNPTVQTLLPLSPQGEMCDINGNCVDPDEDELFKLTTVGGKLTLERSEATTVETSELDAGLIFEQDPVQILDAVLPLYMNSTLLRSLQESLASELAARMTAMGAASDNAGSLAKSLNLTYNRKRQAAITSSLIEIVSGSSA